jgi:putative membrane-bound dehydrogenase-like protein
MTATLPLVRTALVVAALATSLVATGARGRVVIGQLSFTVPDGFDVERVAGPPLVERPIVADFDEEGRLYVAESSGSNDKVEKQLAERPHSIVRLEDPDGDGRFDRRVVFADRMMLPEGAMWYDGSLYVAAPPSIWKLTDTDADGVADLREEWFQGKTLTNCANDLHGPYLGPDGWIYWTKGAFAEQTYERPGRPPLVTRAAHIFRRRPGDPIVESVMSGGMDNPVDVAFTPAGDRILTATFLEHPQLGRRDALIHAIYGGVYGKPHAVIDSHARTGDLMPAISHYGPAAPAGLSAYTSRVFGEDYRGNFFAVLFNLHKVTRHVLTPQGASFSSRDSDFLVSDSLDFHPTDVVEDADGSLLVIDTGAWYKLCCPTSQLAKPDVPGAIYRVRRRGAAAPRDPRGKTLDWRTMTVDGLIALFDDPRPFVQRRAVERAGALGPAAVGALGAAASTAPSAGTRLHAVWALTRIDAPGARAAIHPALADRDETVQRAALHAVGLWRDRTADARLLEALGSKRPAVQRAAAEALGRVGDARAVPPLLQLAGSALDRAGEHTVTYALIEIADRSSTAAGLQASSSRVRRAVLFALDQMHGGGLTAGEVIPLLDGPDAGIAETAWTIAGRHPEWGTELSTFFDARLAGAGPRTKPGNGLQEKLVRFGVNPAIQALLVRTAREGASNDARVTALRAMAAIRPKEPPPGWSAAIVSALNARSADVVGAAVAAARAVPAAKDPPGDLRAALVRVALDDSKPGDLRLDALGAVDGGLRSVEPALFDLLLASLDPEKPAAVRVAAAGVVEKARLDREQLWRLAGALKRSGPLELTRLLPAFDHGSDEALGLEMLASLEQSRGRSSVRADILRPRLDKYSGRVKAQGEALLATLNEDHARQAARLEELLATIRGGDLRRGQLVFNSPKGACASCHAIGYQGGRIGPDLTAIGQIRSERDLLEAIVFPNASFARGYESVVVTTTTGEIHSGVLRADLPDEVVVGKSDGAEERIPRQRIADMQPGAVSLMPAGFADQLTLQELADLLAFLKNTRWGA